MKQSTFLGLNVMDFVKSAFLFLITNLLGAVSNLIAGGHFPTGGELISTLKVAGIATVSYLIKQFLSNSQGVPLATDKK